MSDHDFAAELQALVNGDIDSDDAFEDNPIVRVASFADVGLLTANAGIIVRLRDGSEFQVAVVRSR